MKKISSYLQLSWGPTVREGSIVSPLPQRLFEFSVGGANQPRLSVRRHSRIEKFVPGTWDHSTVAAEEVTMAWATGSKSFEDKMLPHLNAAYVLARWLTGNQQDAEDAVQDAYLRAYRFFGDFRGENARGWLLKIVRNTCYSRLHAKHPDLSTTPFDEEVHSSEYVSSSPETIAIRSSDAQVVKKAIEELPLRYREVLILREIEDMSYAEMAKVINQPLGTVRSTLFRARQELKKQLVGRARKEQSLIAPEPKHC